MLRVWDEDNIPDPQALDLGELIIKVIDRLGLLLFISTQVCLKLGSDSDSLVATFQSGIQQFPTSPFVRIAYANFLIACRQEMKSGWSQLEEARKLNPNMSFRYSHSYMCVG